MWMMESKQQKELKMCQKMSLRVGKPTPKPWEDKKDYEAIFRKFISNGEDGEEHYDVIDMEIEAQRAVRWITDHREIVEQYQKVVRDYNNFMQDYPWKRTEGLMPNYCPG